MEIGFSTTRLERQLSGGDYSSERKQYFRELLHTALKNEIHIIHLFSEPGSSHRILADIMSEGKNFTIIHELSGVRKKTISEKDVHGFEASFRDALSALSAGRIECVFLRHPEDLFVSGGDMVYATMQHLRDEGYVKKIGIAVSSGEEIDRYLYHYDFDVINLPLNVFDQRLLRSGHIAKVKTRDIEVHIRSVFQEGALLDLEEKPERFTPAVLPAVREYGIFLEREKLSPLEGAICFLRAQPELDVIFIDTADEDELEKIIAAFNADLSVSGSFAEFALKDSQILGLPRRE